MKLYLVQRDDADVSYDEYAGKVIRAESELRARELAAIEYGDEGKTVWLDPWQSTCTEILVYGKEEIILSDFISNESDVNKRRSVDNTLKELHSLKLHEVYLDINNVEILRVPRGWIYRFRDHELGGYYTNAVFVPEDDINKIILDVTPDFEDE